VQAEVNSRPDGVIAILRGVTPDRVVEVAKTLRDAGIGIIEVPLNSPQPFESISRLAASCDERCLIGAGTVLNAADVRRVHESGGRLIVAPSTSVEVIEQALSLGMEVMPGFATPTEAFVALAAGARDLKLFPAASFGPMYLRAIKDVLPADARIFPVGGIGAIDIAQWRAAGAAGFGFGSQLFKPDMTLEKIGENARALMAAWRLSQKS
jgi:2-dehydro-3-deoxyphosphogalactonate aldolase